MRLPLPTRKTLWRWTRCLFYFAAFVSMVLALLLWTGTIDRWASTRIISRIETITGGRVELKSFQFSVLSLRAELRDFTLHGREPQGSPPFFHADLLAVDIRVDSLLRRKISLDDVRLVHPTVHVRVDAQGRNNVPIPAVVANAPPGRPLRETVFDLVVRQVRIEEGELLFNQLRVPLLLQSSDFSIALDYQQDAAGLPRFEGSARLRGLQLALQRYAPTATDLTVQFTLTREGFFLKELEWKLPRSIIRAHAEQPSFAEPLWRIRYSADLDFADLRRFLRMPNFPPGRARTQGAGQWRAGALDLRGTYNATGVSLPYQWFHTGGVESSGAYRATTRTLEVPDFTARILGGVVRGRLDLQFAGMRYRTNARVQGMSVAALLAALDHHRFPVNQFHWDATMDAEAVSAWHHDFRALDSRGVANWSPPQNLPKGKIPATARFDFHYSRDRAVAQITKSYIATPNSRIEFDGRLGARDSGLLAKVDARNLPEWSDFIQTLRGPDSDRARLGGHATFDGRVTGAIESPVFNGRVKILNAQYNQFAWDQIDGDLIYSAREFRFDRVTARRGRSSATLDLWLGLRDWGFRDDSGWTLAAELVRAHTDELQSLFGTKVPARALLTGQFRARGTRALPEFTGLLDFTEVEALGLKLDRARGQLQITGAELAITNAELRKSTGRVTGNFRYRFSDANIAFDAAGAVIPLAQIDWLAAAKLPLAGTLSFQVRGEGPAAAPRAQGAARIVDFGVGEETLGSFEARLAADGRQLKIDLTSAMAEGSAKGHVEMTLAGDYPMRGDVQIQQIDLDAFLQTALHLPHSSFTGHSRVDGAFKFAGPLANPRAITVDADISRITFGYEQVRLENEGPVRLTYRADEIRITQARLRGTGTDFQISGFARFNGANGGGANGGDQLGLNVAGQINLQLLGGFIPDLEARGSARVNAAIEGTTRQPRVNGKLSIENAAANYAEFPAGLSSVRGDLVFDAARVTFDNVTAEAGGGRLSLGGSATYGDGPLRYDMTINAHSVRIRYPQGMSWVLGGGLRFAGTARGALLSGRVTVERLLLSEGFDFGGFVLAGQGPRAPATTSPFLRNLQFDIDAVSSPNARMEWAAARFESEAQLRVRGAWERPILLGHIHLLSGELTFRGNRYSITRGDINFSNPRAIDPELNIEATTTIQQYEVTLNFSGPASQLQLNYRSDPPLPASDVVALLALGRTGSDSELRRGGAGQGAELGAGQLLSEAISSQIGGRIERLFGVSRFRIDPFLAGTGTETNASARITVEQQIARDLVITYVTNVSSTQHQIIQVEYTVNREVSIVALRDQNGTFGLDIKFKKRFR